MTRIKYLSVHEREDGERRVRPGKGKRSKTTMAIPTPENDRDEFERFAWERVDFWPLPRPMLKSEFTEWWNDNLRAEDELEAIHKALVAMGEREPDDGVEVGET